MNRPTIRQCLRGKIREKFGTAGAQICEHAEETGSLERLVDDVLLSVTLAVDAAVQKGAPVDDAEMAVLAECIDGVSLDGVIPRVTINEVFLLDPVGAGVKELPVELGQMLMNHLPLCEYERAGGR